MMTIARAWFQREFAKRKSYSNLCYFITGQIGICRTSVWNQTTRYLAPATATLWRWWSQTLLAWNPVNWLRLKFIITFSVKKQFAQKVKRINGMAALGFNLLQGTNWFKKLKKGDCMQMKVDYRVIVLLGASPQARGFLENVSSVSSSNCVCLESSKI